MPQSLTPALFLYLNQPEKARPIRPKNPGCSTFFRFNGGRGSTIAGGGLNHCLQMHLAPNRFVEWQIPRGGNRGRWSTRSIFAGENQCSIQLLARFDRLRVRNGRQFRSLRGSLTFQSRASVASC